MHHLPGHRQGASQPGRVRRALRAALVAVRRQGGGVRRVLSGGVGDHRAAAGALPRLYGGARGARHDAVPRRVPTTGRDGHRRDAGGGRLRTGESVRRPTPRHAATDLTRRGRPRPGGVGGRGEGTPARPAEAGGDAARAPAPGSPRGRRARAAAAPRGGAADRAPLAGPRLVSCGGGPERRRRWPPIPGKEGAGWWCEGTRA